jgi:hypothetical protein
LKHALFEEMPVAGERVVQQLPSPIPLIVEKFVLCPAAENRPGQPNQMTEGQMIMPRQTERARRAHSIFIAIKQIN